jgi:hypothetical protein
MKSVVIFVFFCVLSIPLDVHCIYILSADKAVGQNLFGHCKIYMKDVAVSPRFVDKSLASQEDVWKVDELLPSQKEKDAYRTIVPSYSKVHPDLAIGLVKQKPQAETWANRLDTSWQLHEDHPRNNKSHCLRITRQVVEKPLPMHENYKETVNMYLITARKVLIHENGIVASSCGYYQPLEGCETRFKFLGRKWWSSCQQQLKQRKVTWNAVFDPEMGGNKAAKGPMLKGICLANTTNAWKSEEKVFVISALWDHNYHHLLIDSLTRLIRHLPFLLENPQIKIHIRYSEQYLKKEGYHKVGRRLREVFFPLLGLSLDRLIHGPVIAEEVYIPRSIRCNYPLANAYEIRLVAETLLKASKLSYEQRFPKEKYPLVGQLVPLQPFALQSSSAGATSNSKPLVLLNVFFFRSKN